MEISITSNLTKDGTTVTIDGKTIKNIHRIDFDMYHLYDYPVSPGDSSDESEGKDHFCVRVTSKDVAEDGTVKHLEYSFDRTDDGEIEDSVKDITPKVDHLARFIADSMSGRKNRNL